MRGMLAAPDTELAAVCDVYDTNAARASKTLTDGKAKTIKDFRRVLEMKEVDAIYVATPDFWHSNHTVLGLEAGKPVFVEKPFALTIREGRVMVEAAARTKKILMPATQHRSAPHIIEAASMVASGEIGQVGLVRAWNSRNIAGMWPHQMAGQYDRPHGFAFYGGKAALYVDRLGWELFPETGRRGGAAGERKFRQGDDASSLHAQNFVKQIRIGTKGEVDDMSGFRSTSTCHLGTIAARVNHKIQWKEQKDELPNDPAASRLLTRTFRKPYDLIKLSGQPSYVLALAGHPRSGWPANLPFGALPTCIPP